jgi:hypothetical protein
VNPTIIADLRPQLTSSVLDQGQRGTCLAVATSQAHQSAQGSEPLAPDALWLTIRGPGPSGPGGLWPAEVAAAVEVPGQPPLTAMPLETSPTVAVEWPAEIVDEPWYRARMDIARGTQEVRQAVAAASIVVLVLEVTDAFGFLATSDGIIDADAVRKPFYPMHAVICVGSGRSASNEELFLIRNSWGPGWAGGGDGWVTAGFLDAHCFDVLQVVETFPAS